MSAPASPRERACLAIIDRLFIGDMSPTLQEIATEMNLAHRSQVATLLDGLETKGYIRRGHGMRNIVILRRPNNDTRADKIMREILNSEVAPFLGDTEREVIRECVQAGLT